MVHGVGLLLRGESVEHVEVEVDCEVFRDLEALDLAPADAHEDNCVDGGGGAGGELGGEGPDVVDEGVHRVDDGEAGERGEDVGAARAEGGRVGCRAAAAGDAMRPGAHDGRGAGAGEVGGGEICAGVDVGEILGAGQGEEGDG